MAKTAYVQAALVKKLLIYMMQLLICLHQQSFFSYIATFFQPFLTLYQTDNPMITFLYDNLMKLVIFKPDIVNPCTTVSAIRKIDFDNKDNFLKVKHMPLGFATEKCLSDLQKNDLTSKQQIAKFYHDSVEITKSILMKILKRSPLGSVVVKYAGVFDLKKLYNDDCDCEERSQQFKRLLSHFMKLNILAAIHCDNTLAQFQEFLQSECKSDLVRLKPFNRKEHRLDQLFFPLFGYSEVQRSFLYSQKKLTSSHGQACVERGFIINK